MPLSANAKLQVRTGPTFGYGIAALKHVYAGSMLAIDASNNVQPIVAGTNLAFAGVSNAEFDNSASATPALLTNGSHVTAMRDTVVKIPVSGVGTSTVTGLNIGQTVYALDDASCSLGSTTVSGGNTLTLLAVGTLAGLENGTWVRIAR